VSRLLAEAKLGSVAVKDSLALQNRLAIRTFEARVCICEFGDVEENILGVPVQAGELVVFVSWLFSLPSSFPFISLVFDVWRDLQLTRTART
jgi:hypothetical protein